MAYRSGGAQFVMAERLSGMAQPLLAISAIYGFPCRALLHRTLFFVMAQTLIFSPKYNVSDIFCATGSCTNSYVDIILSASIQNNASAITFHPKTNS